MDESNSSIYNTVKILLNKDNEKMIAIDFLQNETSIITDDCIVEFWYDVNEKEEGFKWKPFRLREDKTQLYKMGKPIFGNNEKIANDIFNGIIYPITEEMVLTGVVPLDANTGKIVSNTPDYLYFAGLESTVKADRYAYQNFHNHYIKHQLYYLTSPSYLKDDGSREFTGKLFDMCSGKGVDMNKIKRAKYAEIVGMDIDINLIKYAQEFYKKRIPMPKPKAFYVRGDSSKLIFPEQSCAFTEGDKIHIKRFIPTKYYFDTISLQFCIHYFFKSEITLRTLMQNLNDNLKIGGFVIGTTFDGERIHNSLHKKTFIDGYYKPPSDSTNDSDSDTSEEKSQKTKKTQKPQKSVKLGEKSKSEKKIDMENLIWRIDKKYTGKLSFDKNKPIYNKEIDVFVKTIGISHVEYLVNFNFFDTIMNEYGFEKVMVKPFEQYYSELLNGLDVADFTENELEKTIENAKKMSDAEKVFSFFSNSFVYKKVRNSSDSLFKKLVKLMESETSKKNKNIKVVKVNNNTEHVIENMEESEEKSESKSNSKSKSESKSESESESESIVDDEELEESEESEES